MRLRTMSRRQPSFEMLPTDWWAEEGAEEVPEASPQTLAKGCARGRGESNAYLPFKREFLSTGSFPRNCYGLSTRAAKQTTTKGMQLSQQPCNAEECEGGHTQCTPLPMFMHLLILIWPKQRDFCPLTSKGRLLGSRFPSEEVPDWGPSLFEGPRAESGAWGLAGPQTRKLPNGGPFLA